MLFLYQLNMRCKNHSRWLSFGERKKTKSEILVCHLRLDELNNNIPMISTIRRNFGKWANLVIRELAGSSIEQTNKQTCIMKYTLVESGILVKNISNKFEKNCIILHVYFVCNHCLFWKSSMSFDLCECVRSTGFLKVIFEFMGNLNSIIGFLNHYQSCAIFFLPNENCILIIRPMSILNASYGSRNLLLEHFRVLLCTTLFTLCSIQFFME